MLMAAIRAARHEECGGEFHQMTFLDLRVAIRVASVSVIWSRVAVLASKVFRVFLQRDLVALVRLGHDLRDEGDGLRRGIGGLGAGRHTFGAAVHVVLDDNEKRARGSRLTAPSRQVISPISVTSDNSVAVAESDVERGIQFLVLKLGEH